MPDMGWMALALTFSLLGGGAQAVQQIGAGCDKQPEAGDTSAPKDAWAQTRLDFPRTHQIASGKGIKVAVIDSGVNRTHTQLDDRVDKVVDLTGTGRDDCVGHGTAVAGIIAAQRTPTTGFMGIAPDARILPYKQTNEPTEGDPALLPKAIRKAAEAGADVINVSIRADDDPALKSAVGYAIAMGAVVVAAAGNIEKEENQRKEVKPAFPANYDNVISVGSANKAGQVAENSNANTRVDVLAPGVSIVSTWVNSSHKTHEEGTSFATAFVSGTAALILERNPEYKPDDVKRALVSTADGATVKGSGHGMINPVQAMTTVLPPKVPRALPTAPPTPISVVKSDEHSESTLIIGTSIAIASVGLAGFVAYAGIIGPMSRRRKRPPPA